MGSFVADLTFRADALPGWGQTVLGSGFRLGPGGKGSNQAVAAARLGARVSFIGKLGRDSFADLARRTWQAEGIDTTCCSDDERYTTGAASVIVHAQKGENAIVVDPGSGMHLSVDDVERTRTRIAESVVFVTQLELALPVVEKGLSLAHHAGAITILNPAPALPLPDSVYELCDYLTPNETEAMLLTGVAIDTLADADLAAGRLLARGARNVIVTLGNRGAFAKNAAVAQHVPEYDAGPVVETTGAGDAFNGALAVGLSEGMDLVTATRFGCRVAGISVTRKGTSESMPHRNEL